MPPWPTMTKAILAGVVSVAAKMGISSLQSYQSAQCFEAVGLDGDLMARFFPNTPCQVGGVGLDAIEAAVTASHDRAFDPHGPVHRPRHRQRGDPENCAAAPGTRVTSMTL